MTFPRDEIAEAMLLGKTFAWDAPEGMLLVYNWRTRDGNVIFHARNATGVVCYISEDGDVSYPGDYL